jgi:hypothetical protein
MQAIADALSDEDKIAFIRENFRPGHVFYLYAGFLKRPKDKYFLLASPDDPPIFLIFNTDIPEFIRRSERLNRCQVAVIQENNSEAVKHDCHLDCTEAFTKFSFDNVCAQTLKDMTRIRGSLCDGSLREVFLALQRDNRIPLKHKVRMLADLKVYQEPSQSQSPKAD